MFRFVLPFMLLVTCMPEARAGNGIIDACDYPGTEAARATWVAGEGSAPAGMRDVDGKPALVLSCLFAGTQAGRGVWDRKVDLDMAQAQGIELEVMCANAGPVSSFSLYLQSGTGWYHGVFSPRYAQGWNRITLAKADMKEDGRPGAWTHITKLRLAAWRGDNEDTEFLVRNVRLTGVLGTDARVLILTGGHGSEVPESERSAAASYAGHVGKLLTEQEIRHATMRDDEVTTEALKLASIVVLPHNPGLPKGTLDALVGYTKSGGKLLCFYTLPAPLAEVAGIEPGKWQKPSRPLASLRPVGEGLPGMPEVVRQASWALTNAQGIEGRSKVLAHWFDDQGKDTGLAAIIASDKMVMMTHVVLEDDHVGHERLLLAMLGRLDPGMWEDALLRGEERLGHIGGLRTVEAVTASLAAAAAANPEVGKRLDSVFQRKAAIHSAMAAGNPAAALDAVGVAERQLREAWCLAQTAKEGEFRAFWCHSAYGVKGLSWDEAIGRLKANGFTAIMPNMLWGGVAYYPSEVLPVAPGVAEKGDQMALCVAACQKHGIQIHVWKVDWNLGQGVPAAFVEKLRAAGRLQRSWDGVEQPWLCPSNPENQALEREAMLEVARRYPIDGIHFDYIRYPGPDHCFCAPCRERFEKAVGMPVVRWPKDVQAKGPRREEWIAWCQGNISGVVEATSAAVRKVRPGIKVSAAVFRNWAVDSRIVMQDWRLWCKKGWLDFVCPMDYTSNDGTYDSWVRQQKTWAGPAQLVPGIGASSSNVLQTADQIIGQINITRRYGSKGFIIFNYGQREAQEILPMLGLGATRK